MRRLATTCLLDLPVTPIRDEANDDVCSAYVTERQSIAGPKGLRPFVRRWRSLWLLAPGSSGRPDSARRAPGSASALAALKRPVDDDVRALLSLTWPAPAVFAALGRDAKPDFKIRACRIAGLIGLPPALLHAEVLANHYGVTTDIALCRIYLDTYPQHDEALRY